MLCPMQSLVLLYCGLWFHGTTRMPCSVSHLACVLQARVQSGTGTLFDKYNLSNTSYMELEP